MTPSRSPEAAPLDAPSRIVHGGIVMLDREPDGSYSATCHGGRNQSRGYGGSVLAHAVAVAHSTVSRGHHIHSLHAHFVRAVDVAVPVCFTAVALRDGKSYSLRRVDAVQEGRLVSTMTVSFKRPQIDGAERLPVLLDETPGPDEAVDGLADRPADSPLRLNMEHRALPHEAGLPASGLLEASGWVRLRQALGDDPAGHAAALAYLSDATLASTAFVHIPGGRPQSASVASLDHAMWFHRPVPADEWLLYRKTSVIERDERTLIRGELWTRGGQLAATVAQEAAVRLRDARGSASESTPQI